MNPLLRVRDLCVSAVGKNGRPTPLVKNVSFDVEEGMCVGLLGESGSGKSLTCRSIVGLLGAGCSASGEVLFQGRNLLTARREELRRLRGAEISMILQNPMTSFDPMVTVEGHIAETLRAHGRTSRKDAVKTGIAMLEQMRIGNAASVLGCYPHQLSGGMLQHVMIGLALLFGPKLLIADEPTTALDSVTRFEMMKEIRRVRRECACAMLFVSHDLGVLSSVADTVLVMHRGEIVEKGDLRKVFLSPKSEHARYLMETRSSLVRRFRRAVGSVETADAAASF